MKHVLVLGSPYSDDADSKSLAGMAHFVQSKMRVAAQVAYCHFDELAFIISNHEQRIVDTRNSQDLSAYDVVWFRGKFIPVGNLAATVGKFAAARGTHITNSMYMHRRAVDNNKISQMLMAASLGLPIPKTVSAGHASLVEISEQHLDYPMILKDARGAHGNTNFLVKDHDEAVQILLDHPNTQFVAQEFIASDGDYRVLLVGSDVIIIHRKADGGSHLNNTSQGGSAKLVKPQDFSSNILEASRRFASACGYEIAGVDVIIDKATKEYYFLEINSQPQLATGAFVSQKAKLLGEYFDTLLG